MKNLEIIFIQVELHALFEGEPTENSVLLDIMALLDARINENSIAINDFYLSNTKVEGKFEFGVINCPITNKLYPVLIDHTNKVLTRETVEFDEEEQRIVITAANKALTPCELMKDGELEKLLSTLCNN